MGQELMARWDRPATPLWSADIIRERPDLIEETHRDFLSAGADVITLSCYPVTPARLGQSGRENEFEGLQKAAIAAAQAARDTTSPNARIAGCLPPLPGSYRPDDRLSKARTLEEYDRIVGVQCDGVDLFLCETLPSVEEARLATQAARRAGKPVWTALTVDERDGHLLRSGEPVLEAADAALEEGAEAILINCSPPEAVDTALRSLIGHGAPVGAYANAFTTVSPLKADTTVDALETRRDLGPEAYADLAMAWADAGAAIIGGCCEIGPGHIAAIHKRR